jgi:flavodoxin
MKSLVVFSSQSGNTKKLADTAFAVLPEPKEICSVDNAPESFTDFEFVAVGFWVQGGKPDPKTAKLLPQIGKRKLFLFATHGAAKGSAHVKNALDAAGKLAFDSELAGSYSCQGEVNPKVIETASTKPEPPVWIGDAARAKGHPNQVDLDEFEQILGKTI